MLAPPSETETGNRSPNNFLLWRLPPHTDPYSVPFIPTEIKEYSLTEDDILIILLEYLKNADDKSILRNITITLQQGELDPNILARAIHNLMRHIKYCFIDRQHIPLKPAPLTRSAKNREEFQKMDKLSLIINDEIDVMHLKVNQSMKTYLITLLKLLLTDFKNQDVIAAFFLELERTDKNNSDLDYLFLIAKLMVQSDPHKWHDEVLSCSQKYPVIGFSIGHAGGYTLYLHLAHEESSQWLPSKLPLTEIINHRLTITEYPPYHFAVLLIIFNKWLYGHNEYKIYPKALSELGLKTKISQVILIEYLENIINTSSNPFLVKLALMIYDAITDIPQVKRNNYFIKTFEKFLKDIHSIKTRCRLMLKSNPQYRYTADDHEDTLPKVRAIFLSTLLSTFDHIEPIQLIDIPVKEIRSFIKTHFSEEYHSHLNALLELATHVPVEEIPLTEVLARIRERDRQFHLSH